MGLNKDGSWTLDGPGAYIDREDGPYLHERKNKQNDHRDEDEKSNSNGVKSNK